MGVLLGLFGLTVFVVSVISLAAGVTWGVVKLSPLKEKPKTPTPDATSGT
jgi:hypothetical protein